MRINRFVALCSGLSRRAADRVISEGKVKIDSIIATPGIDVDSSNIVTYNGQILVAPVKLKTIMLNKPVGYVVSRDGQGSRTIYDLLPEDLWILKPVGRLDKDSSGLLLLSNDGELAQKLTHPSARKLKIYDVSLDKSLDSYNKTAIERGVTLDDGVSKLILKGAGQKWTVSMFEGRNRQIRRTFEKVGFNVIRLHRSVFAEYKLDAYLKAGKYREIER